MRGKYTRFLLLGLSVCGLVAAARAQETVTTTTAGLQTLPEEITVNLPKSLGRLRREVNKAETRVYDIFNEMNDDPEYDIRCKMENRSGTKMKVRVCSPVYYRMAWEEEAETFARQMGLMFEGSPTGTGNFHASTPNVSGRTGAGVSAVPYKNRVLKDKLADFLKRNPELGRAIAEYAVLSDHFKARQRGEE